MSLNKIADDFNTSYMLKDKELGKTSIATMQGLIFDETQELLLEVVELSKGKESAKTNAVKEAIDCIYIAAQQLRLMGVDIDSALKEVHRSNMSKALPLDGSVSIDKELEIARERYPNAGVKHGQRKAVLICGDTNKVIKPTTYSPAVITKEILGV